VKVTICKNYDELSRTTADYIVAYVNKKPDALLCFPSGESPGGTIDYLVQYAQQGKVDFSECRFIGLDEWVGVHEKNEGSCKYYLYSRLFTPLKIKEEKIIFFNALARNLDHECKRVDTWISTNGPIDIMLVGIGLNGHIGLNEPGVSLDSYSHHIELDQVTRTVAKKYFKQETILTSGITLGLKHLMESKVAILIASGTKKAEIIYKAINEEVSNKIPATIIQKHPNSFVFLDKDAASSLVVVNQ
jgi:glucosamine-6-phosphate deaminase